METMFAILANSLKGPKPYEKGTPEVISINETRDCLAGGTAVGDKALPYGGIPVPPIGACREGDKLFILYGPQMVWTHVQQHGQEKLRNFVMENYVEFLLNGKALHVSPVATDGSDSACVRGRIIGGLVDAGYLPADNTNNVGPGPDSAWSAIYRRARDTGQC